MKDQKRSFRIHRLNQLQFLAVGFFFIILCGTLLLTLPIASRSGESAGIFNAAFTAVSATCVTGLIVCDTWQQWSFFGQWVILLLIQIGGLGFITIGVGFSILFGRRIGLRQRDLLKESINALEIGGIVKLLKKIILGTLIFEGIGAVLYAIRFIPEFGCLKGIYFSIFHGISAFCNAGFDLMGTQEAYSSLTAYASDPLINITTCLLITIGGLGFVVWKDIWEKKFRFQKYELHTKVVLSTSMILVFSGAVLLYLFEKDHTLAGASSMESFWASVFGSVTARTAGFNTIDTGSLTSASKMLTTILMFIGGSPGSTAGGIKTTTLAVMVIYVCSNLRNADGCNIFHRRISEEIIQKAGMVFSLNLMLAIVSIIIILATNDLAVEDVIFEAFSAIGTAGMTTGITRDLNTVGKIVIMFLMYCGRVGSMTFALSFIARPQKVKLKMPTERITIG